MFKLAHRHDFVSQKVCRHPSFSVWRRAWTRLVIDTLRGYMVVEIKRNKLCHKLNTDTSFCVSICTCRRPGKSKLRRKAYFSEKNAHCHVSQLIQLVETRRIRRSNGKLCSKLHTDMGSCVKICTCTWTCKSKKWCRGTSFYSEHCPSNQ